MVAAPAGHGWYARLVVLKAAVSSQAAKAPALPLGWGPYDRSLGVGVPPDSPPTPVSFGFCFSSNTGFFFFFLYIAVNQKKFEHFFE